MQIAEKNASVVVCIAITTQVGDLAPGCTSSEYRVSHDRIRIDIGVRTSVC